MQIIKQFNENMPSTFEAGRTQVNVGIVPVTKTIDGMEVSGYKYITVCFDTPSFYTDDALFEIAKKDARSWEVANIKITIAKGTFHGDEEAQRRLKARYDAMAEGTSWEWKSTGGVFISLTKDEFLEIIKNAIDKQDEYWVKYA